MPQALLFVALPLAAVAVLAALFAAVSWQSWQERAIGVGRCAWVILVGFGLLAALGSAGDWQHLIWAVQYPMLGLAASAGLLMVGIPSTMFRGVWWQGVLFATMALLAILPCLLLLIRGVGEPTALAGESLIGALTDIFRFGFGGPIPESMQPEHPGQIARGLGSPERDISVSMGALWMGSAWMAGLALICLMTGMIRKAGLRVAVQLIAPVAFVVPLGVSTKRSEWFIEDAMWRNEPWFVSLMGPLLLAALILVPAALSISWLRRTRQSQ